MKTPTILTAAILSTLTFFTDDASAQVRATSTRSMIENTLYNRPTVSPYLNLTRRSALTGLPTYYTQVRPQIERQQQDMMQARQTRQMQQQITSLQNNFRQQQQQQAGQMITGRFGWSSRGLPRHGSTLNYFPRVFLPRR